MKTLVLSLAIFALSAAAQTITTVAGNSTWGATYQPALDSAGNIYAADRNYNVVYKTDKLGVTTIVAGTYNKAGYAGDGGLATSALLNTPCAVAIGPDGLLYISDYSNQRIRRVANNGIITTIAGTGTQGFSGDNGPASAAALNNPFTIVFDKAGNLFFVDFFNHRIRKISTTGTITTVAGGGTGGDGSLATAANLGPGYFVIAADGTIYFTDDYAIGYNNKPIVRKIAPNGTVSTIIGNGTRAYTGDGGQALSAALQGVDGIAMDSGGNIFITSGDRIRKVAPNGIITTWAGTGNPGSTGDNGPAISATFNNPAGLAIDANDNLYISDTNNRSIRKIAPPTPPSISFTNAVVPVWRGTTDFGSNMYVTIYGSNLSSVTQAWSDSFTNGTAPTTLGGVSVMVNNVPAFIQYVSPTQININTPDDTTTGTVNIVVKNEIGFSNTGTANRVRLSPTLLSVPNFSAGNKFYVVALSGDFLFYIGPQGLAQGVSFKAAKPNDTVVFFATGCGPTNPATKAGVLAAQNSPLASSYQIKIGGVPANVTFAGMLAGTVGLYQFNAVIPNIPAGDQPVELIVDGVPNSQNLVITVGQ
jgi:uncharacterized protein (TIGR03437 family)